MIDNEYKLSNSKVVFPSKSVGIVGVGSYLPDKIIENEDFTNLSLTNNEQSFIQTQSGVKRRRYAGSETHTDMAIKAAKKAVQSAKLSPLDIDLIVVTHITKDLDKLTPANSNDIQTAIGAKNAVSLNVDKGFAGWIYALVTGCSFVVSGFYKTVLVVSGESILTNTDSTIMKSMLVGDGAGAFVLRETNDQTGIIAHHLMSWKGKGIGAEVKIQNGKGAPAQTESKLKPFLCIAPNSFETDLPFVSNILPHSVKKALAECNIESSDIDHYIFGQKFEWLNREWVKNIGADYSKVRDTLSETACVETSSIPIITDFFAKKGVLKKGDYVVFSDLSSNWATGAIVLRWSM